VDVLPVEPLRFVPAPVAALSMGRVLLEPPLVDPTLLELLPVEPLLLMAGSKRPTILTSWPT